MKTVGIIMGSDSDLPIMSEAARVLKELGIDYELTIISAHRTPERLYEYAKKARDKGLKVIIAGAGGAAHLPGMVASITTVPVIGVPVKTSTLSGIDSLYSIVQMPPGIPVATVSINGAKNAGILAAQIIGSFNKEIEKKVRSYKEGLKNMVEEKAEVLEDIGFESYLSKMKE
ncbi:MAG: 5-(carboxyamino)imidazole ribonucleotide mutase [Epulopiscium sp.]|nr:5-(carboxyamino)imidazole ribonucleotide mutase [Candidatus Epulonipiscium sp.]